MKYRDYVLKRLLLLIPVMFGVSIVSFLLSYEIGDPIAAYIGQTVDKISNEKLHLIEVRLGLDKPVLEQYIIYVQRLLSGDWGVSSSFRPSRPVLQVIGLLFPATAELSIVAMLFAILFGIPLGIISAVKKDKAADHISRFSALTGVSMPIFWLGLMVQFLIFSINEALPFLTNFPFHDRYNTIAYLNGGPDSILFGILPATGFFLIDGLLAFDLVFWFDAAVHLIIPAFVLGWVQMAIIARMTRMAMIETMRQDYILLARSKGLSEKVIIYRHALRNAIIPTLTVAGLALAGLLTGAVLTETIFNWPGMGSWAVGAVANLDVAAIQGFVIISSIIYVLSNLVVDLLYAFVDPRIRYD